MLCLAAFLGSLTNAISYPPEGFYLLSLFELMVRTSLHPFAKLQRPNPSGRQQPSPSSLLHHNSKYRNINRFPITYPFRVWLRPRLTQLRLTWNWNPWSFGVAIFHRNYRYSCLHLLFQPLHHASRHSFSDAGMLPYQSFRIPVLRWYVLCPLIFRAGSLD